MIYFPFSFILNPLILFQPEGCDSTCKKCALWIRDHSFSRKKDGVFSIKNTFLLELIMTYIRNKKTSILSTILLVAIFCIGLITAFFSIHAELKIPAQGKFCPFPERFREIAFFPPQKDIEGINPLSAVG